MMILFFRPTLITTLAFILSTRCVEENLEIGNAKNLTKASSLLSSNADSTVQSCYGSCGLLLNSSCSCEEICSVSNTCCGDFSTKCPQIHSSPTDLNNEYIYPEFMCADDGIVVIASCANYTSNGHLLGVRLKKSTGNDSLKFVVSDESNSFPVTDLSTGYTFINWNTFMCFAQPFSRPWIGKSYVKELLIQKRNFSIHALVTYQDFLFEIAKGVNVLLVSCENYSFNDLSRMLQTLSISQNISDAPDCSKCTRRTFPFYHDELSYPISVSLNHSFLSFRSSSHLIPWSELDCRIDKEELSIHNNFMCKIIYYKSTFLKQSKVRGKVFSVVKLALNVNNHVYYDNNVLSNVCVCFFRHYFNINAIRTWRPTILTYTSTVNTFFLVIKILIYDERIFQVGGKNKFLKILKQFMQFKDYLLIHTDIFSYRESMNHAFETRNETFYRDELLELERQEYIQRPAFKSKRLEIACACSATLQEIIVVPYLDWWICSVECEWLWSGLDNYSVDISTAGKMCLNINTPSAAHLSKSFLSSVLFPISLILVFV